MSQPLISIVVPTYNRVNLISETIESALNQTYSNLEIIVLDNNSSDDSYEFLVSKYSGQKNIFIYKNETTLDIVLNWKKALSYANGEYCHILWSDDLIDSQFITKCFNFLINNSSAGFVYTRTAFFSSFGCNHKDVYILGKTGLYSSDVFIHKSLLDPPLSVPVSPANALFRTKDLKKNLVSDIPNNFNIDYSTIGQGNDLLLFLNTFLDYTHFGYLDERLSFFRVHDDSLTLATDSFKVTYNYHIAKAYFMTISKTSKILYRRFNSKTLVLILLGYFLRGESYLSVKRLYVNKSKNYISARYFILTFWKYFIYRFW